MAKTMESSTDEQYLYKSTTSTEITTRSRQDVDGMDGDGGEAMPQPPESAHGEDGSPVDEFPLQMPSGGEVLAIYGFSVCRLSDLVSRGETI